MIISTILRMWKSRVKYNKVLEIIYRYKGLNKVIAQFSPFEVINTRAIFSVPL